MSKFGEVAWNDDLYAGQEKKQTNSKDLWMRLDEGSNELRLITQPHQYLVHKYKKEGDTGFGQKVNCSSANGECPLCKLGDKPKLRWLLGVISRKTGTYKILDVSYAVFGQIRKLAQNTARWGSPEKYDIDIVIDKNGGAVGYYTVQPISKEPLSAADQLIKDNVDLEDLKKRVTPPDAAFVQRRMDKINGVTSSTPAPTQTTAPVASGSVAAAVQAKAAATPVKDDDDDLDTEFPDYSATT